MQKSNKKLFIDLKYYSFGCHSLALNYEEMADEFWKNDIYSNHGLHTCIRIPSVRQTIFRQLQNQKFFLLGSVFKYGVRAAYLQRKLARYSGVLACGKTKDLSHGHSGQYSPQHTGPCQSDKRLAHLRRLCTDTHQERRPTRNRVGLLCSILQNCTNHRFGINYLRL